MNIRHVEGGATMVEFAFSIIVVLILLGAIFDIGIALHEYNYLNHITTNASREISRQLTTSASPDTIGLFLGLQGNQPNNACAKMRDIGANGRNVTFSHTLENVCDGSVPPRILSQYLQINATLPLRCIFICRLLPANWNIRASSRVLVETSRPGDLCNTCIPRGLPQCGEVPRPCA